MLYYIKTEKSWPELGESPNRTNQYQGWCRLVACLEFKQGGRMKTETQIAKENIKTSERYENNVVAGFAPHMVCKTHKVSCERFLEFLDGKKYWYIKCLMCKRRPVHVVLDFEEKITDLKQAIKLYDEAGI